MLSDKNVVAVLAQKDMSAAREFYEKVLGLKVEKETEDGGVAYKSGDSSLFIYQSSSAGTNQATAAAWNVSDGVEDIAEMLKAKGVIMEHYDSIPGVTLQGDVHVMGTMKAIWFKDPSGNILNVVSGM
ncbi:MAG TPA: VOC family protein [Patescibacteria group bacterium]|nr:VOC family protein [Patescibacteria group bacterium]